MFQVTGYLGGIPYDKNVSFEELVNRFHTIKGVQSVDHKLIRRSDAGGAMYRVVVTPYDTVFMLNSVQDIVSNIVSMHADYAREAVGIFQIDSDVDGTTVFAASREPDSKELNISDPQVIPAVPAGTEQGFLF